MGAITILLSIFLGSRVHATPVELKYFVNDKYTNVKISKLEGVQINEMCITNSKCKAMLVAKGKIAHIKESSGPAFHNPAASYCWDVGAKNRILKDSKNNQYDFCVFDDGSMIDAWNLYAKHYPPKRVK